MKQPFIIFMAATIAILIGGFQHAQANDDDISSGNYIVDGCENLATPVSRNTDTSFKTSNKVHECGGAINATILLMQLHGEACPPAHVTMEQSARVISKYMTGHPAKLNQPYALLMFDALHEVWPCKKAK